MRTERGQPLGGPAIGADDRPVGIGHEAQARRVCSREPRIQEGTEERILGLGLLDRGPDAADDRVASLPLVDPSEL